MPDLDGSRGLVVGRRASRRPGDRARPRRRRRRRRDQLPLERRTRPRRRGAAIAALGVRTAAFAAAAGDPAQMAALVDAAGRRARRTRCATSTARRPASSRSRRPTIDEPLWDSAFDSTAKGFMFAAQAAHRHMAAAGGGVIVAITDVAGLQPWPLFARPRRGQGGADPPGEDARARVGPRAGAGVRRRSGAGADAGRRARRRPRRRCWARSASRPTCATRCASASSRTS